MANAAAAQELQLDQELRLQELIRGSMPDLPPSSSRVPPLSDDEIGRFCCEICKVPKLVFDRFRATGACAHEFCVACIVRHIESRVAVGAVPVRCPAAACPGGGAMHPEACKKLLDIDVYDAWCVSLCERAVGPGLLTPMANAAAAQELQLDQELRLQKLIRGSMPDPPPWSSRVPPLRDDEIGRFYCEICMESKLVFDRFRATGACAHEFCVACIVGHIESRVADGAVPVPCPAAACDGGAMHPEACKKLLDIDVFDAWRVALSERAVGLGRARAVGPGRARCPYRDCGELVLLDAGCGAAVGAVSRATCPGCSRAFCLQCEEPWDDRHDGCQGCVLDRLAEGRNWKRCPSCRAMIEKIAGCKSMRCRCGTVFCYDCGSSLCRCFPSRKGFLPLGTGFQLTGPSTCSS